MSMKVKVGGTWRETVYKKGEGQPSYSELNGPKEPAVYTCGGCTSYCEGNCVKGCGFNCSDGCGDTNNRNPPGGCGVCNGNCTAKCSGCSSDCGGGCGRNCDYMCFGGCKAECRVQCQNKCDSCKTSCNATCGSDNCMGQCGKDNTGATLPTKVKIGNTWTDGCGIYYKEYNTWHDISNLD